MSGSRLPNDVFMSELTLMFHDGRTSGNVSIDIKRYDGRTVPHPKPRKMKNGKMSTPAPLPEPQEYMCLIHAKYKKKKISTVVTPIDAMKFQLQFSQFLRSNMDGLRKEKKTKKKTKKATQ